MKLKRKLIISAATALMLSTAVVNSETLQGKEGVVKGSYVYAATTGLMTEDGFNYDINDDNTITITKYTGNAESLTIPSTIGDYKVTQIARKTFMYNESIKEVTIPSSVTKIGSYAFAYCKLLLKVNLSEGLETLGNNVFNNCISLTSITLPDTLKQIDENAFSNCNKLENIVLSTHLTDLPDYLFSNCMSLKSIVIPDNVKTVGEGIFNNCTNLESVTLSKGMTEISYAMFNLCCNLNKINIPDNITRIGSRAFYNCQNLIECKTSDNLKEIGNYAFENCEKMSDFKFNDSLEKIGRDAFKGSGIRGTLKLSQNLREIGDSSFVDTKIDGNLIIPDSVKLIGSEAFSNLNITNLIIEGSPTIEDSAFENCCITNITMNKSPQLKEYVFRSCKKLVNINIAINSEIKWEMFVFDDCINLQKLNGEEIIGFDENGFPVIKDTIVDFVTNNMEANCHSSEGIGFWNTYTQLYVKKVVECETTPEMTDVEKAKALHDWICKNTEYAFNENGDPDPANKNHVDYSVFFYDSTVCEGYARAYTLLLQEAGFKEDEVYYLSSRSHAWNIVKLGNEYYHIDVCHDDEIGNSYNYSHFMLSDNHIKNNCSSGHSYWNVVKPSNLFNYNSEIETPECNYDLGDFNSDGIIDNEDINFLTDYLLGKPVFETALQFTIADLTFDGRVDVYDLIKLRERAFFITEYPTNAVAPKNEYAEVTVDAQGVDLTYKWYYKNKGDSEFTHTEKYDGLKKYSLQMNEARDGRQIYCEITNKYGMVLQTEIVTLYMGNPMEIVKQPETIVAPLGTEGKTNIIVSGDGDLKYEWYFKNKSDTEFTHTKTYDGWKTYSVDMNEARDGRQIYCKITDKYGISIQTDIVTLHMGNPLEITKQPVNVSAEYGNEAKTYVVAKGDGLTYKWYYKNKGDSKFYYTSTYDNMKTYSVDMNEARDGRQIYCEITDKYGVTVQTEIATLNLLK